MDNEKMKILQMIQEGKLTSAEGMELLNALQDTEKNEAAPAVIKNKDNIKDRFLRVRVTGEGSGLKKADVNIPLALLSVAAKFVNIGMGMIPKEAREQMEEKGIDLTKIDFDELIMLIDQGLSDGKLVDVDLADQEHGNLKVEVYVD